MISLPGLTTDRAVLIDDTVDKLLKTAVVAAGVSGGKDSCALGLALPSFLDSVGHQGSRLLIHSDLGSVEWQDSLPTCERLAKAIGWELVVVKRKAGGMLERWRSRWKSSVDRYVNLECVKLILPWSTPSMRFCTAELKRDVICSYLRKRFPGQAILSASGIRRDESAKRKKSPTSSPQLKLFAKRAGTQGYDWHPLLSWTEEDVFSFLREKRFPLHEAYEKYGNTRVSCAYCIMSSAHDLLASTTCPSNQQVYRDMVDLEIESSFAFQESSWLGDVAPQLLSQKQRSLLSQAKRYAEAREDWESAIPPHLLYSQGWPTCLPTRAEAASLGRIRSQIGTLLRLPVQYTTAPSIIARYQELIDKRKQKES